MKMQKILDFERKGINYQVLRFNGSTISEAGTVKDVGAYETIEHAVSQGANVIVDVSSGNMAEALKGAAARYNIGKPLEDRIKVVHIIRDDPKLEEGLKHLYPYDNMNFEYSIPLIFKEINTKWLNPEDRVRIAREAIEKSKEDGFEVKGVVDVTHYIPQESVRQFEQILRQQYNGRQLDYLGIPVGTGRTFVAAYTALNNLKSEGVQITRLIGFTPKDENPIYRNFVFDVVKQDGTLEHRIEGFNPSSRADKLSCPSTDLMPQIINAMSEGHEIKEIDDNAVREANNLAYRLGLEHSKKIYGNVSHNELELEDSASVGFALADLRLAKIAGLNSGNNVGIFVTGRGLYATPSWVPNVRKIERREILANGLKIALGIAGLGAGIGGAIYTADKIGLIDYEENLRQNRLYREKVEMIRNIVQYDSSMLQANNDVRGKYGEILYGVIGFEYPPKVLDEIILKYLELNKDKIQNIQDPRDAATFNALRALVIESQIK